MNIKHIFDNGGETFDRYFVLYEDGAGLSMSHNPKSPQGVCSHVTKSDYVDDYIKDSLPQEIIFEELPEECQDVVRKELEEFDA